MGEVLGRRASKLGAILFLGLAGSALGQGQPANPFPEPETEDVADPVPVFGVDEEDLLADDPQARLLDQLVVGDLADLPLDGFDEDLWALAVRDALVQRKYIRARELTEQILDRDAESFVGHCLMGIVFHRAEGNLPRAFFHLSESRRLFEERFGAWPDESDPWPWHAQAIVGMAIAAGEMGRHEDKIRLLIEHDTMYTPPTVADRGWPLMRLRRYEEARRAVEEAMKMDDPDQVAHAMTALCAIEAELHNREASYQACVAAADYERDRDFIGPTPFTNAAEAGLGMLKFDEAEDRILEGSRHFVDGTVSNPWLDLTQLYVAQGRVTEALDAVREMFKWRLRQPPYMDEQNRAETEMTSAIFLLVAGHPVEAAKVIERAMARPDRTGFTSSESKQLEAASALVASVVHRMAAAMASEDAAAASTWRDGLDLRWTALSHRWSAWSAGRRAASLLVEDRFLLSSLRPYMAGGIEVPEWLKIELVALLGSGVVEVALQEVENDETLDGAKAYFRALRAEASCVAGRLEICLDEAEAARTELPGAELLLRARVSARAAEAALRLGRRNQGLELLDETMQIDPGVARRVGLALPTRFEATSDAASQAALAALDGSPRFATDDEDGSFAVRIEGDGDRVRACLIGPRGTRLSCAQVRKRAGEDASDLGRRAAGELQKEAFAPRLDLTQADLRSLDGSPTAAGGRSHRKLRHVLRDVTDESGS